MVLGNDTQADIFCPQARARYLARERTQKHGLGFLRDLAHASMLERMADVHVRLSDNFKRVLWHTHPLLPLPKWANKGDYRLLPTPDGHNDFNDSDMAAYDLIYSLLELHWTNHLPLVLFQMRQALRPDGLLQAVLLGGDSLKELRFCLLQAESECCGGASPRVSPMLDIARAGDLLQQAGFNRPVIDVERITVRYADMFGLLADLRHMGEVNCLHARIKHMSRRDMFQRAAAIYQHNFADSRADTHANSGGVRASFDLLFLHAWA